MQNNVTLLGTNRTRMELNCWDGIVAWKGPEIPWEMWKKSYQQEQKGWVAAGLAGSLR